MTYSPFSGPAPTYREAQNDLIEDMHTESPEVVLDPAWGFKPYVPVENPDQPF